MQTPSCLLGKSLVGVLFFGMVSTAMAQKPVVEAKIDPKLPDCGIQRAIDEAAEMSGGGIVRLPEGTFLLRRGLVLKSGVEIVGAGMDKTILRPAKRSITARATGLQLDGDRAIVQLEGIPDGFEVGLGTMLTVSMPAGHAITTRSGEILALDPSAGTATVSAPNGKPSGKFGENPTSLMMTGLEYALGKDIVKGETEIHLKNTKGIAPGDELTIGTPENDSMPNHVFVKEVNGNTVVLDAPLECDLTMVAASDDKNKNRSRLVWAVFPMIHGHHLEDSAVRDLTVRGYANEGPVPLQRRYTVSGMHLFDTTRLVLERVAARNWHTDGISIQNAKDGNILHCEATDNLGNGLHPGTDTNRLVFDGNLSRNNAGDGLYFCWHNKNMTITNSKFIGNQSHGIGGLGNPGDVGNTIENNVIADNGMAGIHINGGKVSQNVIRGNTIENNSKSKPGAYPGIWFGISVEDARNYTIEGNTIRSTVTPATQLVGIEERNGAKGGVSDENIIKDNTFSGLEKADVIQVGKSTVVEGAKNVVQGPAVSSPPSGNTGSKKAEEPDAMEDAGG